MMKKKLIGICFLLLPLRSQGNQQDENKATLYQDPIIETTQLDLVYSEKGQLKAHIQANQVLYYQQGDSICPEGINIVGYDENNNIEITLTAHRAHYMAEQKLCCLQGAIQAQNYTQKIVLHTEELYWDRRTKMLHTDQSVRIEHEDVLLIGQGLEANETLSEFRILKPEGSFKIEPMEQKQDDASHPIADQPKEAP